MRRLRHTSTLASQPARLIRNEQKNKWITCLRQAQAEECVVSHAELVQASVYVCVACSLTYQLRTTEKFYLPHTTLLSVIPLSRLCLPMNPAFTRLLLNIECATHIAVFLDIRLRGYELSGKTLFFCFFNGLPAQFIRLDCKANQDTMTEPIFNETWNPTCQSKIRYS